VGIYLGWRGESIDVPGLSLLTFWDRKNTAERVAQGTIQEFFSRMDVLRDRSRTHLNFDGTPVDCNQGWRSDSSVPAVSPYACYKSGEGQRNVRILTIAHSFGGLIAYEALGGQLVRSATRSRPSSYVSRLGDLVIIVNPAFEGTRFEPLRLAASRLNRLQKNQLPVIVIATSEKDWATGMAFPFARRFSTVLENTPGEEGDALVKAVGHNDRYTTHKLALCSNDQPECMQACDDKKTQSQGVQSQGAQSQGATKHDSIQQLTDHMRSIAESGFSPSQPLCDAMMLAGTDKWRPDGNPFWVVSTSGDIMSGHNNIFNPRFVSFMRQVYLGVIEERKHKLQSLPRP
jgi:hypothetical protein